MGQGHKFDIKKLDRLKDPERLKYLNPDKIWEVIGGDHVTTIVDIGAGIGFFAIPFSRKIGSGSVYACDIKDEMLMVLEEAIRQEGVNNVIPLKCEEVKIPLENKVADLVIMINLHHELDHPEDSLKECQRLLRPGGCLAIIDWNTIETPSGPPPHVRIPPEKVQSQLADAGFGNIQSHELLPFHYAITAYVI